MGNAEHYEILKQGSERWNLWRLSTPVRPDLSASTLSARDLRAFDLKAGSDAIAIEGPKLGGGTIKLSEFQGKVVLLDFWAPWSRSGPQLAEKLAALHARYHDKGFEIIGIAIDEDEKAVKRAVEAAGMGWHHIFDGRGWMSDATLRYGVEQPADNFLIGRDGKIRALHLYLLDESGVADLEKAIVAALGN